MEKAEMIYLATKFYKKNYDMDKARYCDDLYGKEHLVDEIWDYVIELEETGTNAFYTKYKEYRLY